MVNYVDNLAACEKLHRAVITRYIQRYT
jgi:hypothetical protein